LPPKRNAVNAENPLPLGFVSDTASLKAKWYPVFNRYQQPTLWFDEVAAITGRDNIRFIYLFIYLFIHSFICSLFNVAIGDSKYTMLNDQMLTNKEPEKL
jgi:hypothetical protein